ncbi:MAG: hypothetical protein HYZ81_09585 [Nitrospinae bacterium]|nr:hypothetical protein [Nitrospinota bacterium]
MKRVSTVQGILGGLTCLGIGPAGLAMPAPAHAGDLHLSIGLGIPLPVEVVPSPVVVAPARLIVRPAPIITYPPPMVISEPILVLSPHPGGLAKKYYAGYSPVPAYKFYKRGRHAHHDE